MAMTVFAHDFKLCDNSDKITITSIDLSPNDPVVGKDLDISITGTTHVPLNKDTSLTLTVDAFGITITQQKFGLCDLTDDCNISNGDFKISFHHNIPSQAPAGVMINAKVQLSDAQNPTLTCVEVGAKLVSKVSDIYLSMLFGAWKRQHGKEYDDLEEHFHRYSVFKDNLEKIQTHNEENDDVVLAMNHLGDLTSEEYADRHLSDYVPKTLSKTTIRQGLGRMFGVPDSVDWVDAGKVSDVKNQGQCGSCWSFSATGALESAYAIQNNKMIVLSEQQLVDCSVEYGNNGCNGGLMDYAFKYVEEHGLTTEDQYPYTAQDGTCRTDVKSVINVSSFVDVKPNDEIALKEAVAKQPVAIAIEADQFTFQFYHSGVLKKGTCGTNLDHGVLLVGYGEQDGTKFWKVKNSWGATWGAQGYVLLERTDDSNTPGTCGVATTASYPVLSSNEIMQEE